MDYTYLINHSCFRAWLHLVLLFVFIGSAPVAFGQTFAPAVAYSTGANTNPSGVALADVNNDGKPDIITANYVYTAASNMVYGVGVLLGNGNGTFQPVISYPTVINTSNGSPIEVKVSDINADNRLDIVAVSAYGSPAVVSVLLGNGNGTFQSPAIYPIYYAMSYSALGGVTVADINSDGKPDIMVSDYQQYVVGVLLGNGNGTFQVPVYYSTGANSFPTEIAVADVNGDGKADLITANWNDPNRTAITALGVLLGNGNGSFQQVAVYSTGSASLPRKMVITDVNGDGKLDVATAGFTGMYNGSVMILTGNGNGMFQPATSYLAASGATPNGIAMADMNGDGKRDIITADRYSSKAVVLKGNSNGTFQSAVTYTTGNSMTSSDVAVADLNSDGKPDMVVTNETGTTVSVFLNTTPGTFLPTRAALPGASATLAPNPTHAGTTLTATGLPAAATQLTAMLTDALGRPVRRLSVPATAGAATAAVPTTGLAAGLYLLRLDALDAQGAALGALPTQRLSVE